MAGSRRLPSSFNVSTYGDGTRDYSSLAAWESDTDIDIVSAGAGEVLDVYDDNSPYDDRIVFSGATTNSSYFRVIRPASGQEPKGLWTQGPCFSNDPGITAGIIDLREEYSQCHDLRLEVNGSSNSYRYGVTSQGGYNKAVGIITKNINPGSTNAGIFWYQNKISGACIAVNCIAYDFNDSSGGGFIAWGSGIDCRFYNCTATNNGRGLYQYGGSPIAKNCVADNNNTDWAGTWNQTTCLDSTDGVTFVDAANDDYHLDSSDTAAKDQGTDLSSDTTYAFDDDIDLETRSGTWDIGADEAATTATDPSVTSGSASEVTSSSATLNGTLDDLGGESSVDVYFEWGTTTGYGNTTTAQTLSATGSFSESISGLTSDQVYHFRAAVTDGVDTWYGADVSFTTDKDTIVAGHFQITSTLSGGGIVGESFAVGHFATAGMIAGSVEHNEVAVGHFITKGTLTGSGESSGDTNIISGHFTTTNTLTGSVEHNEVTAGHFQTTNALTFSSYILSAPAAHFQADNALTGTYELIKYENYISLFKFILTGSADGVSDVEMPITSFQIRMYSDKNSYLSVNIPSVDYADQITARTNGTLKLMIVYSKMYTQSEIRSETLLEVAFDTVRTHDGSKKQSITLEGHETDAQATARQINPKTITLTDGWINYRRTGTDGWTARLVKPHLDLRAGDTIIDDGVSYTADRITWMKSESVHHMEITGGTI